MSSMVAFFLLVEQQVVIYLLTLLAVNTCIAGIKNGFNLPEQRYLPLIGFFLLYGVGMLFTENKEEGWHDLETKAAFLVIPLLYGGRKRQRPIAFSWIIWSLAAGALFFLIPCFTTAYTCFKIEGTQKCFEASRLSRAVHPTYLSLYLIAGVLGVVTDAFRPQTAAKWKKIMAAIVVPILMWFVYQLYSLGPWVGVGTVSTVLLFAFFHWRGQLRYFLIALTVFAGVALYTASHLALLQSDYRIVQRELNDYFANTQQYIATHQNKTGSIAARIVLWNASIDFIRQHPLGVGTGDLSDELHDFYMKNGMHVYAERGLNPHCQYLQTAGAIGIFSAICLLAMLVYYAVLGWRRRSPELLGIAVLFATSALVESLFERQKGVLFFAFFATVLLVNHSFKSAAVDTASTR